MAKQQQQQRPQGEAAHLPRWRVSVPGQPAREIEAATSHDAERLYAAALGVIAFGNPVAVERVTPKE
jgi:hypothetical protein